MKNFCCYSLIIVFVLMSVFSCASGWGNIRYVNTKTFIRVKPSPNAKVVRELMPNDKIKIDFRKGDWAAVFRIDEEVRDINKALGYIYLPHLRNKPPQPPRPRRAPRPLRPPK